MIFKPAKITFLSLYIITFFLACSKTNKRTDQLLGPEETASFSIAAARAWFDHEIKASTAPANISSGPNKYHNIPDWGNAVFEQGVNRVGYWRIPLTSKDNIRRTVTAYIKGQKQKQAVMANPWLLIYQDSTQNTKMLVMQTIPGAAKMENRRGFAGEVKMYNWNGELEVGFVYENGVKKQQIIPARSNRRKPANPNGRWEFMCKDYIDCEFQCQCTGYNSAGFFVHVAFASVRSENSCFYPADDPYASAWSANSSVQWDCSGGWSQTNTTPVNICEDVWVDDIPDPEPEPYTPDPTIETEGYGVRNITNEFTNPCHKKIADDIINYKLSSEIIKMVKEIFGVSVKANLYFKPRSDYYIAYPNTPWPSHVAARHGSSINSNGDRNSTIFLNDSLLANASQEYITASILHEILHSILQATSTGNENYHHNQMAMTYLTQSTALMMDMYGLSEGDARALNVDGLRNTILGSTLYNSLPTVWNSMVSTATEYRNGTKGTACPD